MSLIIGATFKDQFAMMSGDTKTVKVTYSRDKDGHITGELGETPTDIRMEKVRKLSNYVILGHVGLHSVCCRIEDALMTRTKPSDDLRTCAAVLADIIAELREESEQDFCPFLDSLNTETAPYVGVRLVGFFENGNTGVAAFETGPDSQVETFEFSATAESYPTFLRGVGDELMDDDTPDPFYNGGKEVTVDNMRGTIGMIHTCISFANPDSVSSELQLFTLTKPKQAGDPPVFTYEEIDTAPFHERLNTLAKGNE
ncbi:hypothetical protein [Evansella halocellulosilytica]|uniref:hypothetical protein n=1 Tax=Evansella halocellulosilytica TaxID=2011013 RepID=UPI000BB8AC9F|nr:hypothetical protein [Evansella halocellulosilytica]